MLLLCTFLVSNLAIALASGRWVEAPLAVTKIALMGPLALMETSQPAVTLALRLSVILAVSTPLLFADRPTGKKVCRCVRWTILVFNMFLAGLTFTAIHGVKEENRERGGLRGAHLICQLF